MNNFIADGDIVEIVAGGTIEAGQIVKQGQLLGAATIGGGSGDVIPLKTRGVVRGPKPGSQAWTVGALVYWNGTAFTTSNAGNPFLAGCAYEAVGAGAGETTGLVRLNGTAQPNI